MIYIVKITKIDENAATTTSNSAFSRLTGPQITGLMNYVSCQGRDTVLTLGRSDNRNWVATSNGLPYSADSTHCNGSRPERQQDKEDSSG